MHNEIVNFRPNILEDELTKLVPIEENDFEKLFAVASDPLIWEQHPTSDRYKREVFQLFFDGAVKEGTAFLIYDKSTGELIGSTRFYDYKAEASSVAIGYTFLARKYWGGIHNKSVKKLLIDYAFQWVNSVIFHIGTINIRSQKALLKIGARKVNAVDFDYYGKKLLHYEYEIKKHEWMV